LLAVVVVVATVEEIVEALVAVALGVIEQLQVFLLHQVLLSQLLLALVVLAARLMTEILA
jgi:hypothetical protein